LRFKNLGLVSIEVRSVKENCLNIARELGKRMNIEYGGHENAAGMEVRFEDYHKFKKVLESLKKQPALN